MAPKDAIVSVGFNINPGYDKPTATVTAPRRDGAFAFEFAMGRGYPNVLTVKFKPELGAPPLIIDYYVQECKTRRQRRLCGTCCSRLVSRPSPHYCHPPLPRRAQAAQRSGQLSRLWGAGR